MHCTIGIRLTCSAALVLLLTAVLTAGGRNTGSVKGVIYDKSSGEALPSVNVLVKGTSIGTTTAPDGSYTITGVPEGTYTITASLVGHRPKNVDDVTIAPGQTTTVNFYLDDAGVQMRDVMVYGASMKHERVTDAPAAVSVVEPADLQLKGASGQVPRLLESEPGVDIVQSGLYDFNINTRGFNSSLTRRLLVLLDGRDLAIVFLGAQEWNGLSVPIEDLGRLELIRGPGSALYGANAFNGIVNIVTPPPKEIVGTKLSLSGGELNSLRFDLRNAGVMDQWSYKANIGHYQGDTWSTSRVDTLEYAGLSGLNKEVVPVDPHKIGATYGSARVDYDFLGGMTATAEGGFSQVENEIYITGIGRIQVHKAQKPWGRLNFVSDHFNVQVWASGRNSKDPQTSLATGLLLNESSQTVQADGQYRTSLLDDQLSLTAGVSQRYEAIDTKATLMTDPHYDNMTGVYGQAEFRFTPQVKALAALRWDRSTLNPSQLSPKAAVVWAPVPDHTFRVTYNHAFQSPNYSELFLHILDPINPFAYFGNPNLTVEEINGFEAGYKGILGNSLYVTIDGYYNRLTNFITDLAQGVNPQYGIDPILIEGKERTVFSYGNAGKVTEGGAEIGVNYYLTNEVLLNGNYSYFDFTIVEQNRNDVLLPNAPRNKLNAGITYRRAGGLECNLSVKYIPSFDWSAGIYQGRILAYTLVNVAAEYPLAEHLRFGVNVSNLFDRVHYEIFGGSLLKRRALASLTATF